MPTSFICLFKYLGVGLKQLYRKIAVSAMNSAMGGLGFVWAGLYMDIVQLLFFFFIASAVRMVCTWVELIWHMGWS